MIITQTLTNTELGIEQVQAYTR